MTKQPSQLCMMFGGAAIITLSRCAPHLAASVLEQQGWGERSTGCFLALNWNKVTQQWPEVSFIIVATRASSQYVRASPSTYKRTKSSHCSTTAPVLTLKWNEIKRGRKVEHFLILFSYAVCKKQATVSVKFLTQLRGKLRARWLSMLVPSGQQLSLIA